MRLHTTGQGSRGHIKVKVCPECMSDDILLIRKPKLFRCNKCGILRSRSYLKERDAYLNIG